MSQATLISMPSPTVALYNDRPATTSLEVAKFFGKRHTDVLRDISNLTPNCPEKFSQRNFASAEYQDEQDKPRPMFLLFRDGFMLLVMGYTGKKAMAIKIAYIEAFNALEAQVKAMQQQPTLPPAPAQLTQSTADDRKPLRLMVNAWAKTVNVHQTTLWPQIRGHFNIDRIDHLPIEWIPDAIAYVEAKIDDYHSKQIALPEQESLPYLSRRGKNRVQSTTELALKQMMIEANSLNVARDQFEDFFERLGKISGPINRQVAEAIRRTDDRVSTDSLLNTLSYQRWYARERVMDAIRAAHDACCSALVISRLMGV